MKIILIYRLITFKASRSSLTIMVNNLNYKRSIIKTISMKNGFKVLLVIFLTQTLNLKAQCADSSDATIDETKDWIVGKINSIGGRLLPPSKYHASFRENRLIIKEIGINENFELKDTITRFEVDLKDIDLAKLEVRNIGKKGKFGLSIIPKNQKSKFQSTAMGNMNGMGFEIIFQTEQSDMDKRIIKAIRHAQCLINGNNKDIDKPKEKF